MRPSRVAATAAMLAAALAGTLAACSADDDGREPDASARVSPTAAAEPLPTATAAPAPGTGTCYRLGFEEALSPTTVADPLPCRRRHTAETFAVGRIDNVVDGHLLSVDSDRVQQRVASACPRRLGRYVGGNPRQLRLTVLRAVWFTPTLAQADAGEHWYRCDVVAVAGVDRLAPLRGSLRGVLDEPEGRERWAMCAPVGPDDRRFRRVPCAEADGDAWRAIATVPLEGRRYPGARRIKAAGSGPCQDAARDRADDPLDYAWGLEGPDRAQWAAGQRFVRCWMPR